jgi:hypothetical protein
MALVRRDGTEMSLNDMSSRDFIIFFGKRAYNWDLISNPKEGRIDLLFKDHPTGAGVEIEEIPEEGDYYLNYKRSNFLRDGHPPVNEQTLNFEGRKIHFFKNGEVLNINGNIWYDEFNEDKNIFTRHTKDKKQVLVVPAGIINVLLKTPGGLYFSIKEPETIYNDKRTELWVGIPNQYVDNWNYIGEDLILSRWCLEKKIWEIKDIK